MPNQWPHPCPSSEGVWPTAASHPVFLNCSHLSQWHFPFSRGWATAWKSIQVHVRGSSQLVNPSRGQEHHRTSRKAHKGPIVTFALLWKTFLFPSWFWRKGWLARRRRQIHVQNPAHVIRPVQETWWEPFLKGLPKATFLSSLAFLAPSPFNVILFGYFVVFVCMLGAVYPWFKSFLEVGFRFFLEGRKFCPSSGGVERSCLSREYLLQEKESIPKLEFFFRHGVVGEKCLFWV